MANSDVPKGLTPVRYVSGAPYTGACNVYNIPATDTTAVYIGDLVKLAGSATTGGVPTVTRAVSTNTVLGVVVGVAATTAGSKTYRVASTARNVFVADDPNLIFEVQEVSGGTALAATAVGLNANWTGTSGSTITGYSNVELDNSTEETTTTLDFQILRLAQKPDNTIGEHAKWEVRLNNHQLVDGVLGV